MPNETGPVRPRTGGRRYSIRTSVGDSVPVTRSDPIIDRLLEHFARVGESPGGDERLAADMDAVLSVLRKGIDTGRWDSACHVIRVAGPAFARTARWGAWAAVLDMALEGSRAEGDRAFEGWVLHELGMRALATEDEENARRLFSASLEVRTQAGDAEGAAVTRLELARLTS